MAKEAEKKEVKKGVKYVATVMEITHGKMFRSHKHYAVKVIEVPEDFNEEVIEEAAIASSELANNLISRNPVKHLSTEVIEITTLDSIRANGKSSRLLDLLKKIK